MVLLRGGFLEAIALVSFSASACASGSHGATECPCLSSSSPAFAGVPAAAGEHMRLAQSRRTVCAGFVPATCPRRVGARSALRGVLWLLVGLRACLLPCLVRWRVPLLESPPLLPIGLIRLAACSWQGPAQQLRAGRVPGIRQGPETCWGGRLRK